MRVTGSKYWISGYPRLVAEWHPVKNASLYPDEVSFGSGKRVWWKCPRGPDHEWVTTARSRTHGTNCPFCAGARVSVTNSLASRSPRIAAQWHPTKNGSLRPFDLTWGSAKIVWWKCRKGDDHEWRASPSDRQRFGCPFCDGKKTAREKSLAKKYPVLARQWHPTRNGALSAADVLPKSQRRVWWKCSKGPDHEWKVAVCLRTAGNGCPCCQGSRVSVTNALSTRFPEIARQWHPTKNGDLRPERVNSGTFRRVWWKCPNGADHEWTTKVVDRTYHRTGCPFCANLRVSMTNSLASLRPDLAREWHQRKNRSLTPADVVVGSGKRVWWQCAASRDHVFRTQIRHRALLGTSCPFCVRGSIRPNRSAAERRRIQRARAAVRSSPPESRRAPSAFARAPGDALAPERIDGR